MKYIEAEKIKGEIDKIIAGLKRKCNPNPMGSLEESLAAAQIEALKLVIEIIKENSYEHNAKI